MDTERWIIGLAFSVIGGWLAVWFFLKSLRKAMGLGEKPKSGGVPPWLTGMTERLFFTILVAFDISGVPAAMIGWIALKMATNWNRDYWKRTSSARLFGFSALLAGLVSMIFAFLGGLVCKGALW